MPRIAVTETIEIEGHAVYKDLASLPLDEAIKRSETRRRNQGAAERRRNGEVKTRVKRSASAPRAPSKSLLAKLGLADSEAAKSLHAAHLEKVRLHDEKLREFTKEHAAEREELEKAHEAKLAAADDLLRMISMAEKLPDNGRILGDLQKRLSSIE